jgi:thiol-disulfide isomerase/thioredoxin
MKSVRINNTENFDGEVEKAIASGNPVFVLFFGTEEPETSESWCPDCVIADPLIRKAIIPVKDAILIEAPVGARSEWKGNTTHPYRVRFQVPAIPTLYKWSAVS